MRVLIVDDNGRRVATIVKNLVERSALAYDDLVCVRSASEARQCLAKEKFDLMLLDLRIPGRIDEDADVAHSLQLLAEIDAGEDLLMPGKIVGMTAYDDAAEAAKQTFRESTWTLLPTSDFTDSWADTIVKCANYLKRESAINGIRKKRASMSSSLQRWHQRSMLSSLWTGLGEHGSLPMTRYSLAGASLRPMARRSPWRRRMPQEWAWSLLQS